MSDRASSGIFSELFAFIAKKPEHYQDMAEKLWELQREHDFSPGEVLRPEWLAPFGLVRVLWSPRLDCWVRVFKGDQRFEKARGWTPGCEGAPAPEEGAPAPLPRRLAYCQDWEESERGWGTRPDGFTLHVTLEDHATFVQGFNDEHNSQDPVPDEYTRTSGAPRRVEVSEEVWQKVSGARETAAGWKRHGVWGEGKTGPAAWIPGRNARTGMVD